MSLSLHLSGDRAEIRTIFPKKMHFSVGSLRSELSLLGLALPVEAVELLGGLLRDELDEVVKLATAVVPLRLGGRRHPEEGGEPADVEACNNNNIKTFLMSFSPSSWTHVGVSNDSAGKKRPFDSVFLFFPPLGTSFAVASILTTCTPGSSFNFSPSSSYTGANFLQWPHHGA